MTIIELRWWLDRLEYIDQELTRAMRRAQRNQRSNGAMPNWIDG